MNTQFVVTEPNGQPGAQRLRPGGQSARLAHGAVLEQGDGRADGDDVATRIMLGETLAAQGYAGYPTGSGPRSHWSR